MHVLSVCVKLLHATVLHARNNSPTTLNDWPRVFMHSCTRSFLSRCSQDLGRRSARCRRRRPRCSCGGPHGTCRPRRGSPPPRPQARSAPCVA